MPGNNVKITNNYEITEWYVGGLNIEQVIKLLDEVGIRTSSQHHLPETAFSMSVKRNLRCKNCGCEMTLFGITEKGWCKYACDKCHQQIEIDETNDEPDKKVVVVHPGL